MSQKAKVGVLGASGYTGSECVRLLLRHPQVELALLTADRKAGQQMREVFPQFSPFALPKLVPLDGLDWASLGLDLVFCALPHATTQKVIKQLLGAAPQIKVVDLSADFRLRDPALMRAGMVTSIRLPNCSARRSTVSSRSIGTASRRAGLSPIRAATRRRRSSPHPLFKARAIDPDEIVDRPKSGMTGAGRAAEENMLFSEVSEGFHAYGVGHHRHMAELDQEFSVAAGREVVVTFTPHLVPIIAASFRRSMCAERGEVAAGPSCYSAEWYHAEPLVHVLPFGEMPQTRHVRAPT